MHSVGNITTWSIFYEDMELPRDTPEANIISPYLNFVKRLMWVGRNGIMGDNFLRHSTVTFTFLIKKKFFFCLFRAAPMAYGGSQARFPDASLRHSHSDTRSKPHLSPTAQLTVAMDP